MIRTLHIHASKASPLLTSACNRQLAEVGLADAEKKYNDFRLKSECTAMISAVDTNSCDRCAAELMIKKWASNGNSRFKC